MRAILIDDEYGNRELLKNMLNILCPEVEVVATSDSADTSFLLINHLKPDLVFLDIKMPDKNGFDLLRMFDRIEFAVIFVTGFDQYAIRAFDFNAIDYILKPIDHDKLMAAVKKASHFTSANHGNVIHFVHSLEEKTNYIKKFTFHNKDKVMVVDLMDIVYIEADRNYSKIMDIHQQLHISSKSLIEYEGLLVEKFRYFIRISKSHIINIHHLESYTKGNDCVITMKGSGIALEVSRRKKTEVSLALKEL